MTKDILVLETLKRQVDDRREKRRSFIRQSLGLTAGAVAATALISTGENGFPSLATPASAASSSQQQDIDVLNFALNLEYLEAQFYSHATTGQGLPPSQTTGTGTMGSVRGGNMVDFQGDTITQQYANEIAGDEVNHVRFLRSVLGSAAVAMPRIDITGDSSTSPFSLAAQAAGIVPAGGKFNPYSSPVNFLLGAFIFEDVGVTAYKGASPLISNKTYLESAAGILAAEAYHAGLIRTVLYTKGVNMPSIYTDANGISAARDSLDGPTDDDQGIHGTGSGSSRASNIVPLDRNGVAYSRSAGQVLNVVYLTDQAQNRGGFFPNGVNGNIKTSAASA